jgi:hypothetical protein
LKTPTLRFALASLVALLVACSSTQQAFQGPNVGMRGKQVPSPLPPPPPTPAEPAAPPLQAQAGPIPGQNAPLSGPLPYPLLIQVENTAASRPQAGLGAASVVFQYLTEGGITRFSALYHQVPGVVGPVRSARFVSVMLFQRMGAFQMASGGSHWTYDRITVTGIPALINDFDGGKHFFRWGGRAAPHNLFTSQAQMVNAGLIGARPARPDDFLRSNAWAGTVPAPSLSVPADAVSFNYGGGSYNVVSDGAEEVDVIYGVLRPRSVAVMHVRQWITNEQEDVTGGTARDYDLASGGPVELYANGTWQRGTWVAQPGATGRLSFVDGAGQTIGMPPGLMWVVLAP